MGDNTLSCAIELPAAAMTATAQERKPRIIAQFRQRTGVEETAAELTPRAAQFVARWYPQATPAEWNDWRWQLNNTINSSDQLDAMFELTAREKKSLSARKGLPAAITPYYASVMILERKGLPPLRKAVIPTSEEMVRSEGESEDPLAEENFSPVPNLVHRYPDRVLFLTTNVCASYCRYCTRSRMVGQCTGNHTFSRQTWENCLRYIQRHKEVRDVLLSGGDPLVLPDESIRWLLEQLRAIKHVEIIRIGTKVPVVLPQRITPGLVGMLRRFHPLWASIHCTHPHELTPEVETAFGRMADAGIPLGSQTVLLAGINDNSETMRRLMLGLLKLRVRPYYIYQCDPIFGSAHFRTPVRKGIEILERLRGHISGYAVPTFVIDAPGGGGKIPLNPQYVVAHEGETLLLKNYRGEIFKYPDQAGTEERK
jgi:lysine 2,3-aminomutase